MKIKNKKAVGIMGVPFTVLFSIILIIFILWAAFISIRFFLNFKTRADIGLFYEDLQTKVDEAWNSQSSDFTFSSNLPSKIEYICFANLSSEIIGADSIEEQIFQETKFSGIGWSTNTILWPSEKTLDMGYKTIKHIQLPATNPYCIKTEEGKIDIRIKKEFEQALPEVR